MTAYRASISVPRDALRKPSAVSFNDAAGTTTNATTSVPQSASGPTPSAGPSADQVQELREIFQLVDKDGGGTISKEELGMLMTTLGIRATKAELEMMVTEIDVEGTGEIGFDSFVTAMSRKVSPTVSQDKVLRAIKMFEDDPLRRPGFISRDALIGALMSYGDVQKRMNREEAEEIVSSVMPEEKVDDQGYFDYVDWVNVIFST